MTALGLGCVKTPERDTRVEAPRRNCAWRESNHTAYGRLEAALENCIFYILPMYEFLHSQGHSRHFRHVCDMSAFPSIATIERTSARWFPQPGWGNYGPGIQ